MTLKQIQFVEVTEVADDGTFAGRLAQQAQTPTNKGVVPGAPVNQSLLFTAAKSQGWTN